MASLNRNGSFVNISEGDEVRETCLISQESTLVRAGKALPYFVIMLVALFGNSMIAIIFYKNKTMRRTVNYFIVNMAFSDLFIPIFFITREIVEIIHDGQWLLEGAMGEMFCKLTAFLPNVSTAVSIFSLLFIALDRFVAIVFPLKAQLITKKLRRGLIILTWILAISLHGPDLFVYSVIHSNESTVCQMDWGTTFGNESTLAHYSIALYFVVVIVPFALISVLYFVIAASLLKHETYENQPSVERRRREKENKKVIKLALAVLISFALCWAPLNIVTFLHIFSIGLGRACEVAPLYFVALLAGSLNSAINPCLCFLFLRRYRNHLHDSFSLTISCSPCFKIRKPQREQKENKREKENMETIGSLKDN